MEMTYCEQGYFQMGDTEGAALNAKRLECIDKPFWLSNMKITKGWYESVMGYRGYQGDDDQKHLIFKKCPPKEWNQPMCDLTWYDTILFCNRLSEMLDLEPYYNMTNIVYFSLDISKSYNDKSFYLTTPTIVCADVEDNKNANGFRLPYEKEWEYAAKAGTNYEYFGTNDHGKLKDYSWFGKNSNYTMHDVATKKPNAWGFYDMFGLVYEWCYDPFDFSTTGLLDNVNDVYKPSTKEFFNSKNKKELHVRIRMNHYGTIFDANGQLSQNYKELFENFRICRGGNYRSNHSVFDRITNREIKPINPYDIDKIKKNKDTISKNEHIERSVGFRIARNVDDF